MKPHEEEWFIEENVLMSDGVELGRFNGASRFVDDKLRAILAAQAPKMARFLMATLEHNAIPGHTEFIKTLLRDAGVIE